MIGNLQDAESQGTQGSYSSTPDLKDVGNGDNLAALLPCGVLG